MEARFNPVQKSGHIPTFQVGHAGAVLVCFNPVQKSGHIPTRKLWIEPIDYGQF